MQRLNSRIREPVEREGNEHYVRVILLSFAVSVTLTRLFLHLTGYPQIGGETLHIAHLLWGGLLLFAACLVMLTLANRWAYDLGAVLSGVGVGLFIDEVGKFITRANDYFYPPAAPIIYAFFLLMVLLYLELRRPPRGDARGELYRALGTVEEVLDRDLDPQERAELEKRLRRVVREADHPDLAALGEALLHFVASDAVTVVPRASGPVERLGLALRDFEAQWLTRRRLKLLLVAGMAALGGWALFTLVRYALATYAGLPFPGLADELRLAHARAGPNGVGWLSAQLALDSAVGLLLLVAAGLLAANQEARGIRLAYLGLLISVTVVDLMVFYLDQFAAVAPVLLQFTLLLLLLRYRWRYLAGAGQSHRPALPPETGTPAP